MKQIAMFFLVLGLLSGCLHDDKKDDKDTGGLVGTWLEPGCELIDVGVYVRSELQIETSSITATDHLYSDSNCTTMTGMESYSGTYTTGNTITTSDGTAATTIDVTTAIADGGETFLDIFAIIDNKLYFGVEVMGATRPTALDFDSYYVRN